MRSREEFFLDGPWREEKEGGSVVNERAWLAWALMKKFSHLESDTSMGLEIRSESI